MLVRLIHFRGHQDSYYHFIDGQLILIKGVSGIGKSTIFEAIYWGLFGGMREIKPRVESKGRTAVVIEVNNFTINRLSGPELLQLTINDTEKVYEDAEAQAIIDKIFGHKDQWKTCSYIGQYERCLLLEGSNKERMEFLNMLSFSDEDPKESIAKIDAYLKSFSDNYTKLQIEYTTEYNIYQQRLTSRPITCSTLWSIEELSKYENDTLIYKDNQNKTYQRVLDQEKSEGIMITYQRTLSDFKNKIAILPHISNCDLLILSKDIENFEIKLNKCLKYEIQKKEFLRLINKISEITEQLNSYSDFSLSEREGRSLSKELLPEINDEMILTAYSTEMNIINTQNTLNNYNLPYDQVIINSYISKIKIQLDNHYILINNKNIVYEYLKIKSQFTNDIQNLLEYKDQLIHFPQINDSDINNIKYKEDIINRSIILAAKYNLDYNTVAIKDTINKIQIKLNDYYLYLNRKNKIEEYKFLLDKIKIIDQKLSESNFDFNLTLLDIDNIDINHVYYLEQTILKNKKVLEKLNINYDIDSLKSYKNLLNEKLINHEFYIKHIDKVNEFYNLTKEIEKLNGELSFLNNNIPNVTEHDIQKALIKEEKFNTFNYILNKYNLTYNEELIKSELITIKLRLDQQPLLITRKQFLDERENLLKRQQALNLKVEDKISEEDLSSAKYRYEELRKSADILSCPHCSGSIRYNQGKLEPSTLQYVNPEILQLKYQELIMKQELRNKTKEFDKLQLAIDQLNLQIINIKVDFINCEEPLPLTELHNLENKYNELNSIQFDSNDNRLSSTILKVIYNYNNLMKTRNLLLESNKDIYQWLEWFNNPYHLKLADHELERFKDENQLLNTIEILEIPRYSSEILKLLKDKKSFSDKIYFLKQENTDLDIWFNSWSDFILTLPNENDVNILKEKEKELTTIEILDKPLYSSETLIKIYRYQRNKEQYDLYRGKYSNIDELVNWMNIHLNDELTETKANELQYQYQQIINISIISKPIYSSEELKKTLFVRNLEKELNELNLQKDNLSNNEFLNFEMEDSALILIKLNKLKKTYQDTLAIINERKILQENIEKIESELSKIIIDPELKLRFNSLCQEIVSRDKLIEEIKYAQEMCNFYYKLEAKRQKVEADTLKLTNIHTFRTMATDLECEKLENIVDAINNAMNTVLEHIFDEPISVTIQLFRELKSKKKQFKQEVNLVVDYKGGQCTNVRRMSGGEGDRISFALIIALNMISGSPILLLDECLASLDGSLREKALNALRLCICGTKTVVCINHEDVEGHYDTVIPLM